MDLLLLGTAAAGGWPNPFCDCASCEDQRRHGRSRAGTAALLDGEVLLDCGRDLAAAANRAGAGLAGVRHVLVTHGHPDHLDPAFLLWRAWARPAGPLTVHGPAAALDLCRDWLAPDASVALVPVRPGDRLDLPVAGGRVEVRVLAAGHAGAGPDVHADTAVLYDLTAADGTRLLWGTDTGPLPPATLAAVGGRGYDVVALDETFGDVTDHRTGHHDLATFPRTLAALRDAGAVTVTTDVVAVHVGHHNPREPELARRLAVWGVRLPPDGAVLGGAAAREAEPAEGAEPATGAPSQPGRPAGPRRTLLLGGARSGKSREADRRLADRDDVTYVATAAPRPDDAEWAQRVATHRARRPAAWTTLEDPDLPRLLRQAAPGEALLVDCVSLWLAGRLDAADAWSEPRPPVHALAAVEADCADLVAAVAATRAEVVLVSNEVGSGVVPATASGRVFRDLLGTLNARLAGACDEVALVVAGAVLPLTDGGPR